MADVRTYQENRNKLEGAQALRTYLRAGKYGVVTLCSPSGIHHTYNVCVLVDNKSLQEYMSVRVKILNKWQDLGTVVSVNKMVMAHNAKHLAESEEARGAIYLFRMITKPTMNTSMEVYHEGVCSVCGRPLRDPKSIQVGIGPRCRQRTRR